MLYMSQPDMRQEHGDIFSAQLHYLDTISEQCLLRAIHRHKMPEHVRVLFAEVYYRVSYLVQY